jgi:hypothetical protein
MTNSLMTPRHARDFLDAINTLAIDDDDLSDAIRDLLIAPDDADQSHHPLADTIRLAITTLDDRDPQTTSMMRLANSLCPLHRCDYAICFDDDDPDCAAIRRCFPDHDS